MTSHDGFTLNDLVTYTKRKNRANGENGKDGWRDNLSWNCGVEGPSDDPEVEALRSGCFGGADYRGCHETDRLLG